MTRLLAAVLWLVAAPAFAQVDDGAIRATDGSDAAPDAEPEFEPESEPESESAPRPLRLLTGRRPQPSYDGRPEAGPTFAQQLLWVPRVLFFPVYVTWEYLLRVPIGAAVPELEKADAVALLFDFFTWQNRNAGIVPTFFFNFGFLPSVGVYLFWNDAFTEDNDVRVWGGFWGVQFLHAALIDRYRFSDATELEMHLDFLRRPDQVYGGEGYDARVNEHRSRYEMNLWQAHVRLRQRFWRESELRLGVGVERYEFGHSDWGDEPSTVEAIDQGLFPEPANFAEGYTKVYQSLHLAIDSRRPRPAPGTGVRLMGYGELGWNAEDVTAQRWVRWGGTAAAFLDVGASRTIGIGTGAWFSDPLGSGPIPFEELMRLDDFPNVISGFFIGDLRGRSATGLTIIYRYPIWVWLEGVVNVSVANVFGEHLEDFDVERLRLTWGVGISTISERDQPFTLEIAFGTDTFEQGTSISSFRLAVGATQL